jgi:carbamoyl-phosphate synthase small subunit
LAVSQINLNDGTVEGLVHRELPVFAIQYHSEASPGPLDNLYLFDRFVDMMKKGT